MFKKAVQENFIIIAISTNLTMDVENNRIMVDTIESFEPSYWELLNPDGYIVYFRSKVKNSYEKANKLNMSIEELIRTNSIFSEFKVGTNEGQLIAEISWRGHVLSTPIGGPVNDAYKHQKDKEELIRLAEQTD